MTLELDPEAVLAFVRANQSLGPLVIFFISMAETIVILSIFVPSTVLLFGIGGIFAAAGIPLMPSLIAGWMGAALGFSLMYILSAAVGPRLMSYWPFRTVAPFIERTSAFMRRWGRWGVAIGHFGGPIRVLIPIVCGISHLPPVPFMVANLIGALAWVVVFFAPGHLLVSSTWFKGLWQSVFGG
ncbi:MAG: DedA family protein [Proteobacteria bacterium]|nr:DedA family protein [Pseudomonadota bacterium]